jgi:Ca2+-binding RTX toxin-like protein
MIIEAKANRQPSEPQDPRKRLDFNLPEKASRIPIYFALLITGIAAYLKSAFPAQSQGDTHTSGDGLPSANGSPPRSGRMESGREIDDTITGSIGEEAANAIGQSRNAWNAGLSMPDGVPFSYSATSFDYLGPRIAAFFPAAFDYQPQNDNAASVPGDVSAGAGDVSSDGFIPPYPPHGDDEQKLDADDDAETEDEEDDEDEDEDEDEDGNEPAAGNRAPIVMGPVRLHDVFAGQVVLIGLSQLLFGATDPDGDALTINDITATGGTLVQVGAGWSFITMPGMLGVITFSYDISDGLVEIMQIATLEVVRNTILLTPRDDVFVGTPYDDDIDGLAGDDIIDARGGNDIVVGGLGDDHINGGDGDDQLFGGLGNDVIFGGSGDDLIGGGQGNDRLFGEDGDDVIDGDEGDDLLMGGAGNDILNGGDGNDELEGNEGDDVLIAGLGEDMASGDGGNDVIEGNAGDDELDGGSGDDVIDGGEGCDVILGGEGDDMLIAGAGSDVVEGDAGDDQLLGDEGDDTLTGGAGNDMLDGGGDDDTLYGGEGDDRLLGGTGDDEIYGSAGNDVIEDGEGDDEIDAGDGDDVIGGSAGYDLIDGGDGHDILDYSSVSSSLYVDIESGSADGAEIDEDFFEHIEEVIGGGGDDTFVVGATAVRLTGSGGNDLFIFTVTDNAPTVSREMVHEILDFVVGDRVHVANYEISRKAAALEEERFEELYKDIDEGFEGSLPIRVTHAFYDDMDHTIIEADFDRDETFEVSIVLDGVQPHMLIGSHLA